MIKNQGGIKMNHFTLKALIDASNDDIAIKAEDSNGQEVCCMFAHFLKKDNIKDREILKILKVRDSYIKVLVSIEKK